MEASDNTKISSFKVDFFSLRILLDLLYAISRFFLSYYLLLRCQFRLSDDDSVVKSEQKSKNYDLGKSQIEVNDDRCCLSGQEINMVIKRLGIQHSLEGLELRKIWGFDEISGIFEQEPSLIEVREAFDVFDQNRDGFIDAGELQRVLCGLRMRQGSELQACRRMIQVFDQDGDGNIDFNEFVRFMLHSFS